jgi:hypothetical protein
MKGWRRIVFVTLALVVGSCADVSYVQTESPNNPYKDYKSESAKAKAIVGVGEPISRRQMRSNAVFSMKGKYALQDVMHRVAGVYNVAVRWGNGVRRNTRHNVLLSNLSFDEARTYVEDVFDVQIVREGERRLLILPSASEPRIEEFAPGANITLADAVRGLADECGFNMVISENKKVLTSTRVTTNLKDVTCYDAFAALLHPYGMSLVDKGDYYAIGGLPTRQWTLNLHEPERDDEREASYTSTFSGSNEETGSEQELGGAAKVKVKSIRRLWNELAVDLNNLLSHACREFMSTSRAGSSSSSNFEPSLLPPPDLVAGGGSSGGGSSGTNSSGSVGGSGISGLSTTSSNRSGSCGYVRINHSVGLVQMSAPESVLDRADDIIRQVEDVASRRLLLEARVLAVKRERFFDQGGSITGSASGTNNDLLDRLGFSSITAAVQETILQNVTNTPGGLNLNIDGGNLDAVVRAVERFGTTYLLMQPTIELMDRQQATLVDGSSQPYIIRDASTETTTAGAITSFETDLKFQFFGLQFAASAQVADYGEPHTVNVQIPILTKVGDFQNPIFSGSNQIGVDPIPIPETRLIDQKVRIRDGEIKVIGGLTKTIAVDKEAGVPLLREIPAFGKLANQEGISFENVEFVVLLQVKRLY